MNRLLSSSIGLPLRALLALARRVKRGLLLLAAYVSYAISHLRNQAHYVLEQWQGERTLSGARKVAVFGHFDAQGAVHDFVLRYLDELLAAGFEIVFVSNSPCLLPDGLQQLRQRCAVVARRRNLGYDFGAYKDGIGLLGNLQGLDELLIANDSVYGPFHDLKGVLAKAEANHAAVWGITDCWDRAFHLQSYFVLFKQQALRNPTFAAFWSGVRYVQAKTWVVRSYEVGLTRALMRGGLRCAALFPYRQAAQALSDAVRRDGALAHEDLSPQHKTFLTALFKAVDGGVPLNGSHFFWDHLIAVMGCPFLKRELLHKNPAGVMFVNQWETVVKQANPGYDTDPIHRHLEATLRHRAM
jgi:hypothetical protein